MKRLLIILITFLTSGICSATNYYVATTGNNANDGVSISSPWATITYSAANSILLPGDTVWIKAGSYGAENVIFTKSGTEGRHIVYRGYQTTPGDTPPSVIGKPNMYVALSTSDMPTINGGNRTTGVGVDMEDVSYVTLMNLQITQYAYGVIGGDATARRDVYLYNVIAHTIGSTTASYSGLGFRFGSMSTKFANHCKLERCAVVNACAEGVDIAGDNNEVIDVEVHCNESTSNSKTDYFMIFCGSYNIAKRCTSNITYGSAGHHAFVVKSNAEQFIDAGLPYDTIFCRYNQFIECLAVNQPEGFSVRHRWVQFNYFYKCRATGTNHRTGAAGDGNLINIRDGASWNVFEACIADSCLSGIRFIDSVEDGDTGGSPTGHPGHGNIVKNCVFNNCYYGIHYNSSGIAGDAGNNLIANCTFVGSRYFINASRSCDSMKYVGLNIIGNSAFSPGGGWYTGSFTGDVIPNGTYTYWKDCNYYNIEGGMPTNFVTNTVGGISSNPLFVNEAAGNFRLQSGSPCIDLCDNINAETRSVAAFCQLHRPGKDIRFFKCENENYLRNKPHIMKDFDGYPVKGSYRDIGAFESY